MATPPAVTKVRVITEKNTKTATAAIAAPTSGRRSSRVTGLVGRNRSSVSYGRCLDAHRSAGPASRRTA